MRVSGFSFVRDAVKLDFPVVEAVTSILPVCDEFVIAVGECTDGTCELLESIGDDKLRILHTKWDPDLFVHGAINAQQTNLALGECTGDWCFYIQADEVLHEKYLDTVRRKMETSLGRPEVEGLLFDYVHFWGSYDRYHTSHNWYSREIRVIRNGLGIKSWRSAQSFRRNGAKLKVVHSGAEIYHYGWVRDPGVMKAKQKALDSLHHDAEWVRRKHPEPNGAELDYGDLRRLAKFRGTHPAVMRKRIAGKSWTVPVEGKGVKRQKHKHETLRMRLLSFLENRVLRRKIAEGKNYVLIR
jgi:glycosyltransferase involved in cell wall biosynthesis